MNNKKTISFQLIYPRDAEILAWLNSSPAKTSTMIRNALFIAIRQGPVQNTHQEPVHKEIDTPGNKDHAAKPVVSKHYNEDLTALLKLDQEFN